MSNPYSYWRAALAGEKPKMFVDSPECGFYRKGVYEKQPNKARKRVGWEPVAIFLSDIDERINAMVGSRHETDRDKINELWSYCAAYPISEETYRAVAERGENWPDSHEEKPVFVGTDHSNGTDKTMTVEARMVDGKVEVTDVYEGTPADKIAHEIAECKKLLPKYENIDSDEMASKARSLQQRFLDLRGEAKKHYEAANRPLLDQQKELRRVWSPLQDDADASSVWLRRMMGTWEDTKREATKRAAEAAEKAAREHAQAEAKAREANQPAPLPPPEPEKPNTPPPSQQIRGGAGRAARVTVQKYVTAIDIDAVFKQFRDAPEVAALLTDIAQRAVRAGIAVPGATVEEKSDVR